MSVKKADLKEGKIYRDHCNMFPELEYKIGLVPALLVRDVNYPIGWVPSCANEHTLYDDITEEVKEREGKL